MSPSTAPLIRHRLIVRQPSREALLGRRKREQSAHGAAEKSDATEDPCTCVSSPLGFDEELSELRLDDHEGLDWTGTVKP